MADQNKSASEAYLYSPVQPEEKTRGQFSVQFWDDRFFLFYIPITLFIPILPILIPEQPKKTRPLTVNRQKGNFLIKDRLPQIQI